MEAGEADGSQSRFAGSSSVPLSVAGTVRRVAKDSPTFRGVKSAAGLYEYRTRKKLKALKDDSDDDSDLRSAGSQKRATPSGGLLAGYAAGSPRGKSPPPNTDLTPGHQKDTSSELDAGGSEVQMHGESSSTTFDVSSCSWVNVPVVVQRAITGAHDRYATLQDQIGHLRKEVDRIQLNYQRNQEWHVTQFEGLKRAVGEVTQAMAGSTKDRRKQMAKLAADAAKASRKSEGKVCKCSNGFQKSSAVGEFNCMMCGGSPPRQVLSANQRRQSVMHAGMVSGGVQRGVSASSVPLGTAGKGSATHDDPTRAPAARHSTVKGKGSIFLPIEEKYATGASEDMLSECSGSESSDSSSGRAEEYLQKIKTLQAQVDGMQVGLDCITERSESNQFRVVVMENKLSEIGVQLGQALVANSPDHVFHGILDALPRWLHYMGAVEEADATSVRNYFKQLADGPNLVREELMQGLEALHGEFLDRIEDLENEVLEMFNEEEEESDLEETSRKRKTGDLLGIWRHAAKKLGRSGYAKSVLALSSSTESKSRKTASSQSMPPESTKLDAAAPIGEIETPCKRPSISRRVTVAQEPQALHQRLSNSRRSTIAGRTGIEADSSSSTRRFTFQRAGVGRESIAERRKSRKSRLTELSKIDAQKKQVSLEEACEGSQPSQPTLPEEVVQPHADTRSHEEAAPLETTNAAAEEGKDHSVDEIRDGGQDLSHDDTDEVVQSDAENPPALQCDVKDESSKEDLDPESHAELLAAAQAVVSKAQQDHDCVPQVQVMEHSEERLTHTFTIPADEEAREEESKTREAMRGTGSIQMTVSLSADDSRDRRQTKDQKMSALRFSKSGPEAVSPRSQSRCGSARSSYAGSSRGSPVASGCATPTRQKSHLSAEYRTTLRVDEGLDIQEEWSSRCSSFAPSRSSSVAGSRRGSAGSASIGDFETCVRATLRHRRDRSPVPPGRSRTMTEVSNPSSQRPINQAELPHSRDDIHRKTKPKLNRAISNFEDKHVRQNDMIKKLKERFHKQEEQVDENKQEIQKYHKSTSDSLLRIEGVLRETRDSAAADRASIRQTMSENERRMEAFREEFMAIKMQWLDKVMGELQVRLDKQLESAVNQIEAECERINAQARIVFPRARKEDRAAAFSASEARWYVLDSRLQNLEEKTANMELNRQESRSSLSPDSRQNLKPGSRHRRRSKGVEQSTGGAPVSKVASNATARLRLITSEQLMGRGNMASKAAAGRGHSGMGDNTSSRNCGPTLGDVAAKDVLTAEGNDSEVSDGLAVVHRAPSPQAQETVQQSVPQSGRPLASQTRQSLPSVQEGSNSPATLTAGRASTSDVEDEFSARESERGRPRTALRAAGSPADREGSAHLCSPEGDTSAALTPACVQLPTHEIRQAEEARQAEEVEASKASHAIKAALAQANAYLSEAHKESEMCQHIRSSLELEGTPPPLTDVPVHSSGSTLPIVTGSPATTGLWHFSHEGGADTTGMDGALGHTVLAGARHKDLNARPLATGPLSKNPAAAASAFASFARTPVRPHSAAARGAGARGAGARQRPAVPRGAAPGTYQATPGSDPYGAMRIALETD